MSGIEFVDEPPPSRGRWDGARRREMQKFAAELKENPGRWAIYPWPTGKEAARAMASRISNGHIATFAKGFSAVSRGDVVYVSYEEEDR